MPVIEGKALDPFRVDFGEVRTCISKGCAEQLLPHRYNRTRLAYRDVASATNRVTLIAALIPAGSASTHTVFCLRTRLRLRAQHFLCGLFNSFVVNYLARLRVTTHVTTAIVERLPIPAREHRPDRFVEIAAIARGLAKRPHGDEFARLNACVADLYQLTREEFAHVLDTFPLVPREERDRAMAAFLRLGQETGKRRV